MSTKEKPKKKLNRGNVIIFSIIAIWSAIILIWYVCTHEQISYASSDAVKISNAQSVDLDEIISENTKTDTREEIVTEEVELEYITKYQNTDELVKGNTRVAVEGRNGTQKIITKKTYDEQGNVINEEQVSATVVKSSINKIIEVGTAEPQKVATSKKPSSGSSSSGLSFDMALNKPSGLSLEQFKTALTDSKDKNNIFENNAEYFYYIEDQYNINGIFVAAVGIHESGWGTSKLAKEKYNLFGYGAYDSNPYNGAYTFTSYSESIDLIARVFAKYYLNPKGTSVCDGIVATGQYYSGSTLTAVNKKYASDSNWAKSVYTYMQYLYGKI